MTFENVDGEQNKTKGCYLYIFLQKYVKKNLIWFVFCAHKIKTRIKKKVWIIFEKLKKNSH